MRSILNYLFDRIAVRLGKGLKPGVTFERLWRNLKYTNSVIIRLFETIEQEMKLQPMYVVPRNVQRLKRKVPGFPQGLEKSFQLEIVGILGSWSVMDIKLISTKTFRM